jgi:fumarylacetoacetase
VSGPGPDERGCLLELTWDGTRPLALPGGATRAYLEDGDVVRITATAPGADGVTIGLGSVEGRVVPPQPISGSDTCPSGGSDPDR